MIQRKFLLFILLVPFLSPAQEAEHKIALRGDFGAVHETSNELFDSTMNGVIGGNLSVQFPIARDLFVGVGGTLSFYEQAEAPPILLEEETSMFGYGPFLHVGYQPYLAEIFILELSVKSGFRFMEFDSPFCAEKGRKRIHKQSAFYYTPQLGFWWDTGDGLKIGAIVSHEVTRERFDHDLVCRDALPNDPSDEENYRAWNFGFGFMVDLVGN